MNITLSQTKADYLARVRDHLADIPEDDLEEVIQDLEAHLAEVDDREIETELGTPADFALEFRISAGLEGHGAGRLRGLRAAAKRLDRRIENGAIRLGELARWQSIRPFWIWIRGWLLVSAWGVLTSDVPFRHFPVPNLENSSRAGLVIAAVATWLSLWVEREPMTRRRRAGTRAFSAVAGFALLASFFSPPPHPVTEFIDPFEYITQLTAANGKPVENIYAYDVEGNPVEVLLFDQDGEPLLTLSEWLYEEARFPDGQVFYGEGAVRFPHDEFGRIIPNLYPLEVLRHDPSGELEQVPPPYIGFPSIPEAAHGGQTSPPATIGGEGEFPPHQ